MLSANICFQLVKLQNAHYIQFTIPCIQFISITRAYFEFLFNYLDIPNYYIVCEWMVCVLQWIGDRSLSRRPLGQAQALWTLNRTKQRLTENEWLLYTSPSLTATLLLPLSYFTGYLSRCVTSCTYVSSCSCMYVQNHNIYCCSSTYVPGGYSWWCQMLSWHAVCPLCSRLAGWGYVPDMTPRAPPMPRCVARWSPSPWWP